MVQRSRVAARLAKLGVSAVLVVGTLSGCTVIPFNNASARDFVPPAYEMGETLNFAIPNGFTYSVGEVKVHSAKYVDADPQVRSEAKRWLVIDLEWKIKMGEEYLNYQSAKVSQAGKMYMSSVLSKSEADFPAERIHAGDSKRGTLTFEAPYEGPVSLSFHNFKAQPAAEVLITPEGSQPAVNNR